MDTLPTVPPTTPPIIGDTTVDHTADLDAIHRIIADTQQAMNDNDADLLAAHFAANGTGISVQGTVLSGRQEILETSRRLLAGPLADQRARYAVDDVTFLRPDVALCRKRAWAVDEHGRDLELDHAMVATYVLVREDGRWWIAARQNTLVSR